MRARGEIALTHTSYRKTQRPNLSGNGSVNTVFSVKNTRGSLLARFTLALMSFAATASSRCTMLALIFKSPMGFNEAPQTRGLRSEAKIGGGSHFGP